MEIKNIENTVIKTAFEKSYKYLATHKEILISISGGYDSDVMLDMLWRTQ